MMKKLPTLQSERLTLRPFNLSDAKIVQALAGTKYVAKTTLYIPHPYEEGEAEKWINTHEEDFIKNKAVTLAITDKEEKHVIGAITLGLNKIYDHGEIAYWIGKEYSGKGYCTEAARRLIRYGFKEENLNRIYARYMDNNPASGRVMEKIGMKYEGTLKQHVKKWGEYYDLFHYGLLKSEYEGDKDAN